MCAEYRTIPCELQFDDCVPNGGRTHVQRSGTKEPPLALGFIRNRVNDEDLLSKFGLSWWADVDPMLDADGRLSVRQSERLLGLLRRFEPQFELAMLKVSELE